MKPISLVCLVLFGVSIPYINSLAVMSIDFGSEWMKIGIVSPGVPMEIALNKESKRKTPNVVSFRDNVRSFGDEAQTVGIRFPKNAYFYLLDLLGKDINHPLVKLFQERFPYYNIVADNERGTILFKHDDETFYSPEELVAQLFHRAKEFAEQSAFQPIKECVITVPGYFNQVERKSILQAAQLADLKVLQLINDYMAVALNYGIFRTKDFNETAQYVMFYDMGASSTTATIVSLQNAKIKEKGYVETHPQISIIGVGYDRTLGGLELQIRLRDFLAKKFNEMKKTSTNVFENPRAMAKLFKEAGRVKNVLSANSDHYAQIEGLLDDKDFKFQVTREDFENLSPDVFDRVGKPVEQALKTSGLTMDLINQVVLVGAGTRVPKVQDKLQEIVKMELAKNLNTDEAATMGAVYKAADLSTGFQVKKFITKDAVLFPIQVTFERETDEATKQMKRTLFGLMNHYPQKKIITFNKHVNDFKININYGDLDYLSSDEVLNIGGLNLTEIQLIEVSDVLNKNKADNIESKGIKAHFNMDESGVLNMVNVEFVFEKTVLPETEDESTLSKLGNTFSKLFSGSDEPSQENNETKKDEKEQEKTENVTESSQNKTKEEQPKDVKPKVVVIKEPLKATESILSINMLNKVQLEKSVDKLKKLNDVDKAISRRENALNNLESFVIDVQNKLPEREFTEASTAEEQTAILTACAVTSEWLYEDGSDADATTYESKLESLKTLTSDLFYKVDEHRKRPEAIQAFNEMLNGSRTFLVSAKNLTKTTNPDRDVFTDVEISALDKLISEMEDWLNKKIKEQDGLKKYEAVKLTVRSISEKMQALDREMKYLVNKIKLWKPKKIEKPVEEKVETPKEDNTAKNQSSTNEPTDEVKVEGSEENSEGTTEGETKDDVNVGDKEQSGDSHVEL